MKDYKEILEGVVNIINTTEKCDTGFVNICSYIGENCPEFKESEDERIRKKLIEAVKGDMVVGGTKDKQLAIAWLEKQGKKSVDKLKVSNELYEHIRNTYTCIYNAVRPNTFTDMTNYLLTAARSAQSALDMIENQGETKLLDYDDFGFKPAIEVTTEEKVDNANKVEPKDYNDIDPHFGKPIDEVEPKFNVGDVIRQTDKPEYTYTIREIKDGCYICDTCDFSTDNPLLELVKKKEWSEEDEKRIKNILSVLGVQVCWDGATGEKHNPYQKEINWLKSLRPQSHWKPSDEQIKCLEMIVDYLRLKHEVSTSDYGVMKSLLKQLNEL